MPRKELDAGRSPKFLAQKLGWAIVMAAAAVYKYRDGSTFYTVFWSLFAALFVWYALIMRTLTCPTPGCGEQLELDKDIDSFQRCKKCGAYVEVEKGKAWTVEADRVAATPVFAAAIGGPKDPVLNRETVAGVVPRPTVDGGVRRLEFSWPEGCCVCGNAETNRQTVSLGAVGRFAKALGFADERLTFTVVGIPHCAEHNTGAALDIEDMKLVLKFRSNPYHTDFRKLNNLA